ncbi:MAG TPA: FecR domain-containing protein [Mucilaginibacter sp.]|nr:FecR domain-containing protein [Mucilaginibacter sp.]
MKPSELKNLINRYLNHEATETERQLVDVWYQSFDEQNKKPDLSAAEEQRLKNDILDQVKGTWKQSSKLIKLRSAFKFATAAMLCLAAFLGVYRYLIKPNAQRQEKYLTILTGTREVKKIGLPDGSAVWINANSHLRISEDFQKQVQRNVYLDEGEAFFTVKKNVKRPFVVFTRSVHTRVLGTSFNINSYKTLHKATITVVTGRVQVSAPAKVLGMITPGLQISYAIRNGSYRISRADALQVHSWTAGQSILNQASFDELALVIKNVYGVRLIGQNKATAHYKYNLHINTTHTLDETMKIICSIHQNTYKRRKNNEITIY